MNLANRSIAFVTVFTLVIALCVLFWGCTSRTVDAADRIELCRGADVQQLDVTSTISETLLFTHSAYLPLVGKSLQPLIGTLKSKYVFVERQTFVEYSGNCTSRVVTSLPVYTFYPDTGILMIYPPDPALKLQLDDMGYVGWWIGGGGYYVNYIRRFQRLPFSTNGLTLTTMLEDGTVFLEYMTMTLTLMPGTEWLRRTVSETTMCVFTNTERIINYNFQERDNIVYYNGLIR